jgi:hypothetical protein
VVVWSDRSRAICGECLDYLVFTENPGAADEIDDGE